jgi:hypothetical protein
MSLAVSGYPIIISTILEAETVSLSAKLWLGECSPRLALLGYTLAAGLLVL